MHNIYIADCVHDGGVYTYRLHSDGTAELLLKTPADRPMYLAKKNGKLYVLLREPFCGNVSGLAVYETDQTGKPHTCIATVPVHGICGCHLCVTEEEQVYVANYLSGNVVHLPKTVVTHTDKCGPNEVRQDMPHTHFVGQSPDNTYILATDLGQDSITVYDSELNEVSTAYVPAGSGARHLAFSEDGKTLFCVNELASSVSAFAYENGKLSLLDTANILPEDFTGQNTAAAIRVRGEFIYASNRGHNSIACLTFHNGKLKLLSLTPCGGRGPRDFNLFDNFLVCTNEDSGNVTFFQVDGEKLVKLETELQLNSPLCVVG